MPVRQVVAVVAIASVLVAVAAATASTSGSRGAAAYCRSQGGIVQSRYPAYGTNDPASQIRLGSPVKFCKFTASDKSRIYAALSTLYSRTPTLAALAYLTKPKAGDIPGNVNPASVYCSRLGGSDSFGGINAAGGGWVSRTDQDDPVLQACVFPDGSIIDSFGLFYNQDGTIRGTNLKGKLRYSPANPPNVFGT